MATSAIVRVIACGDFVPGKLEHAHPVKTAGRVGLEDRSAFGSSRFSGDVLRTPIPGQQFVNALGGMIGQASEHVGEPGLRVDIVELGGGDQRVDGSSAPAAFVGAGIPVLSPQGNGPQLAFGGVVRHAKPPILEEAGEGVPPVEAVVDRFGRVAVPGEPGTLFAQPVCSSMISDRLRSWRTRNRSCGMRPLISRSMVRSAAVACATDHDPAQARAGCGETDGKQDQGTADGSTGEGSQDPGRSAAPFILRRAIKQVTKRDYVTYERLNAIMPSEEITPQQIEEALATLNERGINVVETEKQERGRARA